MGAEKGFQPGRKEQREDRAGVGGAAGHLGPYLLQLEEARWELGEKHLTGQTERPFGKKLSRPAGCTGCDR